MFKSRSGSQSARRFIRPSRQWRWRRLSLTVVVAVLAVAFAGCDWVQFGLDPGGSRNNSSERVISTANVSTLVQRFSAPTGGAIDFSSPAIANGIAYIGSGDELDAFNATSGALDWTATTTNIVASSPAVANGVVYVTDGNGILYAFDAAGKTNCSGTPTTCSPLWTSTIGEGSPNVSGGNVYVTGGGVLSAINAATGATLWSVASGGTLSDPVLANGVVYVGFSVLIGHVPVAELQAYDATSGAPLWTGAVQHGNLNYPPQPAVAKGVVYVGAQYDGAPLSAFDAAGNTNCSGTPKTCSPLWTSGAVPVTTPPAIANGVVYESSEGFLATFDATGNTNCSGTPKTCSPLWEGNYGGNNTPDGDAPAVANGVVYVGTENDNLLAFDAAGNIGCSNETCNPLWTATTGGSADISSPAVANGIVYVGSGDGNLYAYGLP
jgi:eukaryotic-like serine/threonine-protein kinase